MTGVSGSDTKPGKMKGGKVNYGRARDARRVSLGLSQTIKFQDVFMSEIRSPRADGATPKNAGITTSAELRQKKRIMKVILSPARKTFPL